MSIYFERVNNRYRGPFEKQKLAFIINEIDKNLNSLYVKTQKQRDRISGLYQLSENTDIAINDKGSALEEYDASQASGQRSFESVFRAKLKSSGTKITKESIRDIIVDIQTYLDDVDDTINYSAE